MDVDFERFNPSSKNEVVKIGFLFFLWKMRYNSELKF